MTRTAPSRSDRTEPTAPTRRWTWLGRSAPWVTSLILHGIMIIIGLGVVWTIRYTRLLEPVTAVVSPDVPPAPMSFRNPGETESAATLVTPLTPPATPQPLPPLPTAPIAPAPLSMPSTGDELALPVDDRPADEARFAGTSSGNARRICYVLDASGSMRLRFAVVVDELLRSIDRLRDDQQFAVILFQRGDVLIPPVTRRPTLLSPTEENKRAVAAWLNSVVAAGRTDPIPALDAAIRLRADTIFLLSNDITGSGQYEISQPDLLAELERLNPVEPRTGRRAAIINAIQFLDSDPLDTLREIAERHGAGEGSYNFISRTELAL
jgi:hypothetical protein